MIPSQRMSAEDTWSHLAQSSGKPLGLALSYQGQLGKAEGIPQ